MSIAAPASRVQVKRSPLISARLARKISVRIGRKEAATNFGAQLVWQERVAGELNEDRMRVLLGLAAGGCVETVEKNTADERASRQIGLARCEARRRPAVSARCARARGAPGARDSPRPCCSGRVAAAPHRRTRLRSRAVASRRRVGHRSGLAAAPWRRWRWRQVRHRLAPAIGRRDGWRLFGNALRRWHHAGRQSGRGVVACTSSLRSDVGFSAQVRDVLGDRLQPRAFDGAPALFFLQILARHRDVRPHRLRGVRHRKTRASCWPR